MYGREYRGRTLNFEPSGGLMNSALVMQDQETDSYWSIMTGGAVAGEFDGTPLREMPVGEKAQWRDWVAEHPDTLVLSVGGREDVRRDPYARYYAEARGFRGQTAEDDRLDTKEPIYAFELEGGKFAVPHDAAEGGGVFELPDGSSLFLFREPGSAIFASTWAYRSSAGFVRDDGDWIEASAGARFDPEEKVFVGGEVENFSGFDTFWYTWSLTHPDTEVLR